MNTKEKYIQLLGVGRFPALPMQLPKQIQLSTELIGDLPKAIALTTAQGIEFDQQILWDGEGCQVGDLREGTPESVGDAEFSLFNWFENLFGQKPLGYFHTHITEEDESKSYEFSSYDIADYRINTGQSYFQLCGSELGIAAVFQTKKSARPLLSSLLLSTELNVQRIERNLDKTNFELADQRKQAKLLNKLGFGYYIWRPPHETVSPKDLRGGVTLTKIRPG